MFTIYYSSLLKICQRRKISYGQTCNKLKSYFEDDKTYKRSKNCKYIIFMAENPFTQRRTKIAF